MRKMFRHDAKTLLLILGSTLLIPLAAFAAVACTDDSGPAAEGHGHDRRRRGTAVDPRAQKRHPSDRRYRKRPFDLRDNRACTACLTADAATSRSHRLFACRLGIG